MTQHHNPLERTDDRPGGPPDAATDGATSIGNDAGVFEATGEHTPRGSDDTADSGMDQARSGALQAASEDETLLPPPADYRADSVVRGVGPDARGEMERSGSFGNEANFTKGQNAPTMDQSRANYTVEQMDQFLTEAPRGVFPDTPGGAGATPLSADRPAFINEVTNRGHFPSRKEAEMWTRAVFNALRQRAIEVDDGFASEFASVVRVGEAPGVQVEEMMWGGDFVDRFSRLVCILQDWTKAEFYQQVAEEAHETVDDPWVDAAVYSFFGATKQFMGDTAQSCKLGELQDVWDRA